jgi:hypothetical protein
MSAFYSISFMPLTLVMRKKENKGKMKDFILCPKFNNILPENSFWNTSYMTLGRLLLCFLKWES